MQHELDTLTQLDAKHTDLLRQQKDKGTPVPYAKAVTQKWYRLFTSMVCIKTFVLEQVVSSFASQYFKTGSITFMNHQMIEFFISTNTLPVQMIPALNPTAKTVEGCVPAWPYLWNTPTEFMNITQFCY